MYGKTKQLQCLTVVNLSPKYVLHHPPSQTLEDRLDELKRQGILVPSGQPQQPLSVLTKRPGALRRFLDERNV